MAPRSFTLKTNRPSTTQEDSQKQSNSNIRDVKSSLSHHINNDHHMGKTGMNNQDEDQEEEGVRIITITGENTGASMHGELDEGSDSDNQADEEASLTTYTNSNFQAINNSLMVGGTYECKDPGVHIQTCMQYAAPQGGGEMKHENKDAKSTSKCDPPSVESSDEDSG